MSRGPRKSKEVREAEAQDQKQDEEDEEPSEFHPHLHGCKFCERDIAMIWIPVVGQVCEECAELIYGRATPAEPGTTTVGQKAQLAPPENSGPAPDLLGQGKEPGGEGQTAQLALFES